MKTGIKLFPKAPGFRAVRNLSSNERFPSPAPKE